MYFKMLRVGLLILFTVLLAGPASAQYYHRRVVRVVTVVRPASYWHPHPRVIREVVVHQHAVIARRVVVRRFYRR